MDTAQEKKRIKKHTAIGCLLISLVVISIPAGIIGYFVYEMNFKETTLKVSHSPNGSHKIKVVEKGEPTFFGVSSVRIYFGTYKHEDRSIGNDGKTLDASNVSIDWKNNNEATVILFGEEQEPEKVQISFGAS